MIASATTTEDTALLTTAELKGVLAETLMYHECTIFLSHLLLDPTVSSDNTAKDPVSARLVRGVR